jgi:hypothetical protein
MTNHLYKIEEQKTTGWELVESNLTKESAQDRYDALLNDGVSPKRIKVTRIQ